MKPSVADNKKKQTFQEQCQSFAGECDSYAVNYAMQIDAAKLQSMLIS